MLSLIDQYKINILERNNETFNLAKLYIENKIIPQKYFNDALHIASASINKIDCLLSFNFQHILKTKVKTQLVNLREGYHIVTICKPSEVLDNYEK
jgi:hypothetical protein